jgi:uncharacterized protein (TIGR03382 family)
MSNKSAKKKGCTGITVAAAVVVLGAAVLVRRQQQQQQEQQQGSFTVRTVACLQLLSVCS